MPFPHPGFLQALKKPLGPSVEHLCASISPNLQQRFECSRVQQIGLLSQARFGDDRVALLGVDQTRRPFRLPKQAYPGLSRVTYHVFAELALEFHPARFSQREILHVERCLQPRLW